MIRKVKLSRQKRHLQDGVIAFKAGSGSSRMRIFVTRRKEIKAAQKMNARYWNKKAQKFGNYWMFGAGSKSRKQNAH
jgi:hypothetical protein